MPMQIKHEDRTIAYQIITFVFVFLFIVFTIYVFVSRYFFSQIMLSNARESVSHLAHETILKIDSRLEKVELVGRTVIDFYHQPDIPSTLMDELIYDIIYEVPEIESITFASEPATTGKIQMLSYYYKHNQAVKQLIAKPEYQYRDWYQIPQVLQRRFWTEPWFDELGTEQLVVSFCIPIFVKGVSQGILRIDTKLQDLQNMVSPLRLRKSGYAFLLSNNGTIITHPDDELIMDESIFSLAEHTNDESLRALGKSMIKGEENFRHIKGNSIFPDSWIFYSPLLNNNWSLGVVIANEDVLRDLNLILIIQLLSSVVAFLCISIIVYTRTLKVSQPLRVFSDVVAKIGQGDFDAPLPSITKTYEIDRLSQAVASMQSSLKEYIKNLEITNAEKNRIVTEVRIASEIQQKLLPVNPEKPICNGIIRAYGILQPAGDIGGDLYDFIETGGQHFAFAIADVAGKGIVAAMTMTIVSTFLRMTSAFLHGDSSYKDTSSKVLEDLNKFLCHHNIESNFVTVLTGIIDLNSGIMQYSNAGHVPLIIRKMDRSFKTYAETHSNPVGLFEYLSIGSSNIQLDMGDEIMLFTDGITEAMNTKEEFLGVEGLEKIVKTLGTPNPETTTKAIFDAVNKYSENADGKDDITILTIQYKSPSLRS